MPLSALEEFFDRPCKLRRAVRSLERWQILTHDPYTALVRLLVQPALRALSCGPAATQPVLFPNERPLDAALAQTCQPGTPAAGPARPAHATRVLEHDPCVPEHKSVVPDAPPKPTQINVRTFKRLNVSTIKRKTLAAPPDLRDQVSAFVGPDDFDGFWARAGFWTDALRLEILAGSLRYLQSGIKSGEVKTRTTPGKHLWNQFRHDCRSRGLEALV